MNVRSAALDPKGIPKACRAAASGEKNNSLYKASLRPRGAYYKRPQSSASWVWGGAAHYI
ncbi:hypothetical protein [Clostridium magnum]|uniref:hypothetical protein n=1 Tax=Clostridium magnum TaxID=33954 RepID=UPI00111501D4|nr:hypothetical protein [Clostridium magnum]